MGALAVIWAPVRTLSRVAEERRVLLGLAITAAYAATGLVVNVALVLGGVTQAQLGTPLPPGFEGMFAFFNAFVLVSAVISPFVTWLLVAGLMQLVTGFFGGDGPFSGMLAVVGVSQVPLLISTIVAAPLQFVQPALNPENPAAILVSLLGGAIGLAFLAWFMVLVVVGAAFSRRVGYGESAGSCAISCGGCLGLIIIAVLAIVLVAVLVGASAPAGPS